jgi:hypothetical protein
MNSAFLTHSVNLKNRVIIFLACILTMIFFTSCKTSKFGLNSKELQFLASKTNNNKMIKSEIFHDKKAIKKHRDNGVYVVKITQDNVCIDDTGLIKSRASAIAKAVNQFMNHRESYKYFDVQFESEMTHLKRNALNEIPSCYSTVRMPINSLDKPVIKSMTNSMDIQSNYYR